MKIKGLIISILIPLSVGIASSILSGGTSIYQDIVRPSLSPPGILFPIVWTILYILMGISSYIIYSSNSYDKEEALFIYFLQLLVNAIWSPIFFRFRAYLLAFLVILILIGLVIAMILKFFKINKTAAYLQIPYLIWLLFAAYLNISIYLLN